MYYHYRTKEEILASLLDEHLAGMDAIVEWGQTQPTGPERRRGVLERYSVLVGGRADEMPQLVRFLQESQTSIKELAAGAEMRLRFQRMAALLVDPGAGVADQIRSGLALIALHMGARSPPTRSPVTAANAATPRSRWRWSWARADPTLSSYRAGTVACRCAPTVRRL